MTAQMATRLILRSFKHKKRTKSLVTVYARMLNESVNLFKVLSNIFVTTFKMGITNAFESLQRSMVLSFCNSFQRIRQLKYCSIFILFRRTIFWGASSSTGLIASGSVDGGNHLQILSNVAVECIEINPKSKWIHLIIFAKQQQSSRDLTEAISGIIIVKREKVTPHYHYWEGTLVASKRFPSPFLCSTARRLE